MAKARKIEGMKVDIRSDSDDTEDESSYTAQTAEEKSLQLQTPPTPPPSPLPGNLQERQFLSDQDRQTQLQTFLRPGTNIVNFQGSPTGIEQRRQYYRDSPQNSENGGVENPVNKEETVIQSAPDRQNALTETQEENYVLDLNENAENPDECLDTVDSFEPLIEGRSDLNANVSTVDVSHVAMVYRIMSNQSSPQNAFKYLLRNAGLRGNLFEAAVAEIYQAWRHVTQYAYSRVPALLNKVQESPGGLTTFLQLAVYKVQSLLALVEGNKDGLLDTLTKASALLTIPFQPGIATQLAYVYLHYGLACSEENQKKEWMMRAQTLFRQDSNDDADDGSTDDIEARCGADIIGHGLDKCYQSTIPLYYEHQFYQFYKKLVQQPIIALAIDLRSCLSCIDRR